MLAIQVPGDAFYRSIVLVAFAACVAHRAERGLVTRLETNDPGSELWRHLRSIDFFNVLGVEASDSPEQGASDDRCAPLLRITDFAVARRNAEAPAHSIERKLPTLAPSPARMARFVMEELGANIVQHSARPQTGFGLAQAFPKLGRFELAFADRGVGFAASLQRNPELAGRIHSDAEALRFWFAPKDQGVVARISALGLAPPRPTSRPLYALTRDHAYQASLAAPHLPLDPEHGPDGQAMDPGLHPPTLYHHPS
ncbi:MAG: hypothetical protein JNN27_17800 [Planctomycetes bacterium]|nr:hypothetical protein [Planctomycetota bacterium]